MSSARSQGKRLICKYRLYFYTLAMNNQFYLQQHQKDKIQRNNKAQILYTLKTTKIIIERNSKKGLNKCI